MTNAELSLHVTAMSIKNVAATALIKVDK